MLLVVSGFGPYKCNRPTVTYMEFTIKNRYSYHILQNGKLLDKCDYKITVMCITRTNMTTGLKNI